MRTTSRADVVHHHLLPLLVAADRALDRGEAEQARAHVRAAATLARAHLQLPTHRDAPVSTAIARAQRVWGDDLEVASTLDPLPRRVTPAVRRALHDVTLESLHNLARHAPDRHARVGLRVDPGQLHLTVAGARPSAAGPPAGGAAEADRDRPRPDGETPVERPDAFRGGYGRPALHRVVAEAGGHLHLHQLDATSIVEARFERPTRRRWRR